MTYKATADGFKPGSLKVVSLATWQPGVLVACRLARKFSHPRKPAKRGGRDASDWEASLRLPGAGRYELIVFVSPGIILEATAQVSVDQADGKTGTPVPVLLRPAPPVMFRGEDKADRTSGGKGK